MLKVYEYSKCSTCVKALKFLKTLQVPFSTEAIVENPPSRSEIEQMLTHLKSQGKGLKNLFNTSGLVYKELKLSEKLPTMSEAEALQLLAANGKLIKRPFVIGKNGSQPVYLVGFNEDDWKKTL